jgi:hypothetical protein
LPPLMEVGDEEDSGAEDSSADESLLEPFSRSSTLIASSRLRPKVAL